MASVPQINKSATLADKQKHIIKHSSSIPMLNMLIKNKLLKLEDLDQEATDDILLANGWLALDEIAKEDLILDKVAPKVDPVHRMPQTTTDALALQGKQATEGLVKINLAFVLLAHRSADTDAIVEELSDLIRDRSTIQIG